jgi:type IV pilus assembly protein PilM
MVELSKEGGRFKLKNYGLFELESIDEALNLAESAGGSRVVRLSDQDLVWGIKEVLKRSKISTRNAVVASVPSFSTFATVITMPYLSEKDMAKSINFEARKYIPFPLDEVVIDWSIINLAASANSQSLDLGFQQRGAKPPTVEVFLVAVPKQEIERYKNIMKAAGLNLRALELENAALIRSLVGNDLSPLAIVNIGGRSTSILIVDGGFERISHNYEIGGFEITKSISRSLNVNLKRAEELKRNFGIKEVDNNVIEQAMSSLIDMMVFETKKTIHNYEEVKKNKITKIVLVGGLANMPNFPNYFGAKLGMPLILGNALARVVLPDELNKLRGELNSTFSIAIGLAMREI